MRVHFYSLLVLLFMIEGHVGTLIYSMYPDVMEPGSPFYRRNSTYTYADPVNFPNNFYTIYSAPDGFTVAYQLFSEQINGMPAAPNVTILNQTLSENHIYKPETNLYSSTGVYLKGKACLAVMNTNFAIGIVMLWATNDPSSPTELIAADFYWMGWDSELMVNVSSFPQDREYNQVTSIAVSHPDTRAVVAVAVYNSGVFRVILLDVDGDLPQSLDSQIWAGVILSPSDIFSTRPVVAPYPEGGSQNYVLAYGYQISKFSWAIAVQLIDDNVALSNISNLVFPLSALPLQLEMSYIGNDVVVVTFQLVNATHSSIRQEFISIVSGSIVSKQELAAVEDTSITYVYATNVIPNGKLLSTWSISSNNNTFYGLLLDYFNTSNPPVQFSLPAADAAVPIERLIVTPLSTFSFAITQVRTGETTASSFSNYYIVSSCDDGITTPNENCVQGNQGCVNCMCSVKDGYYATLEAITCKTICGDNIVAGNETCDNTNDANCVDCTCVQGLVWSTTALLCVTPSNNNDSPTSSVASPSSAVSGWSNDYIAAIILCPAAAGAVIFLAVYFGKKRKQQAKSKTATSNPIEMNEGELGTYGSIPTSATDLLSTTRSTSSALEGPVSGLKSSQTVDRLNVPYAELKFLTEIGAGAYGKVFIGEWQRVKVALKINTSATGADFEREAKLMVELRPHPNVVQMLGVSSDGPYPVMILEFCDGGSLDKKLFDLNNAWTVADQLRTVNGIAKGLYHLHKNQIIHRDISARNILLNHSTPKISDFGLSRSVSDANKGGTTKSNVGPIRWMSPEALKSMTYSTKSDVWTFGIVTYEIVARKEPHLDADQMYIGVQIRDQAVTPVIPEDCDPCLKDIMLSCWNVDPEQRPTMEDVCDILDQYMDSNKM